MSEVTRIMYKKYALNKLKYDFMGYPFDNSNQLSFHHLIIAHRDCKELGFGNSCFEFNGAILRKNTSHSYLHIIEQYDFDRFMAITSEMIDENVKGYLDMKNLKYIDDILQGFEREFASQRNKKGKLIIREKYTKRILRR